MEGDVPAYSSGSTDQASAKRRRTRRHRNAPPASANTASSSASSTEESGFTDDEGMANCLILLAQGGCGGTPAGKFSSKRFTEAAGTTTGGRAGFYVYECKTCNKCFPSFQALGGHRASHKKLKMASEAAAAAEEKKGVLDEVHLRIGMNSVPKRTEAAGKGKVHECSICGSEFSSGQALGGHMRRHRPAMEVPDVFKKEKNVLALDLNLPAPAEDEGSFTIAGKPLVFSPAAAALVDCHY